MIKRAMMFLVPLALGVGGFLWMTNRPAQDVAPVDEAIVAVRVLTLDATPREITATGFGRVSPVREWDAATQVQGRVEFLADGLAVGQIVEAGTILARIDPTDYDLAVQRTRASIAAAEAQLSELALQEQNTARSLKLQERILDVSKAEFARVSDLVQRGSSTQAALETAQSALLTQESAVLNLQNTLVLIPAQKSALEASLAAEQVSLSEAQAALERTTLVAPFRGRVSALNVEASQFARAGDVLLSLQSADAAEVVAEFQPRNFLPVAITIGRPEVFADGDLDMAHAVDLLTASQVQASVRLEMADFDAIYPARLVRMRGTIAEETGTLGLVVQVDDPLTTNPQSRRPPLNVGSFVSVDVTAPASDPLISVPRNVLRYDDRGEPFVYLASDDDTLAIRAVNTGFILGDQITITAGLSPGDRLILSDPRPPIPGLKLTPVEAGEGD
jgi:multidrug efflux pump subunit AcrA (membrane-fusion protein)